MRAARVQPLAGLREKCLVRSEAGRSHWVRLWNDSNDYISESASVSGMESSNNR